MRTIAGIVLIVVGVVLFVMGVSAAESFASDVSKFFTGSPTDKSVWLMLVGVAAVVAGLVASFLPMKGRSALR